jgi:tripartite ATP-independent transporter DctM subunit
MISALAILIGFFGLMLLGMPIAHSMIVTSYLTLHFFHPDVPFIVVPQRVFAGMNSYALMCIPFFMLAGELMSMTPLFEKLLNMSKAMVGHIRGGLSHVNIVVSIFFAGMTGSAVADTSATGSILIPAMFKEGYPKGYTIAVTVSSSCLGVIIPPSNLMIVAALATGQSVAMLFVAGIIPGLLTGLSMLVVSFIWARRFNFPKSGDMTWRDRVRYFWESLPALGIPVIIMGGILLGIITPTEAADIVIFYAIVVGIFGLRCIPTMKQMYASLTRVSELVGEVMFALGAAIILGWIFAIAQVPDALAEWILSITTNPSLIIIGMIIAMLLVGTFMDPLPCILIFTPIFMPIAESIGMGKLHFTVVMVYGFIIGLITPPCGSVLYVGAAIGDFKVDKFTRDLIPFMVAMTVVCVLMAFVPEVVTILPDLLF